MLPMNYILRQQQQDGAPTDFSNGVTRPDVGVTANAESQRGYGGYGAGEMGMPGASSQSYYQDKLAALRMQSELATAADNQRKQMAIKPFDSVQSTGMYSSDPLQDMQRRMETFGSMNPTQQYYLQQQMQGLNQGQAGQLINQYQPQQVQAQAPQQNRYLQPFQQTNSYQNAMSNNYGMPSQQFSGFGQSQQPNNYMQTAQQPSFGQPAQSFNQPMQQPQQNQSGGLFGQQNSGFSQQTGTSQSPQNRYGLLSAYGTR